MRGTHGLELSRWHSSEGHIFFPHHPRWTSFNYKFSQNNFSPFSVRVYTCVADAISNFNVRAYPYKITFSFFYSPDEPDSTIRCLKLSPPFKVRAYLVVKIWNLLNTFLAYKMFSFSALDSIKTIKTLCLWNNFFLFWHTGARREHDSILQKTFL